MKSISTAIRNFFIRMAPASKREMLRAEAMLRDLRIPIYDAAGQQLSDGKNLLTIGAASVESRLVYRPRWTFSDKLDPVGVIFPSDAIEAYYLTKLRISPRVHEWYSGGKAPWQSAANKRNLLTPPVFIINPKVVETANGGQLIQVLYQEGGLSKSGYLSVPDFAKVAGARIQRAVTAVRGLSIPRYYSEETRSLATVPVVLVMPRATNVGAALTEQLKGDARFQVHAPRGEVHFDPRDPGGQINTTEGFELFQTHPRSSEVNR